MDSSTQRQAASICVASFGADDVGWLNAEDAAGGLGGGGERGGEYDGGTESEGRHGPRRESVQLRCHDDRTGKCDGQAERQPPGGQLETAGKDCPHDLAGSRSEGEAYGEFFGSPGEEGAGDSMQSGDGEE